MVFEKGISHQKLKLCLCLCPQPQLSPGFWAPSQGSAAGGVLSLLQDGFTLGV